MRKEMIYTFTDIKIMKANTINNLMPINFNLYKIEKLLRKNMISNSEQTNTNERN